MPTATGLSSAVGAKKEVTYGTPVTVDRFFPFNSETLQANRQLVKSEGIVSGRVTYDEDAAKYDVQRPGGTVSMDCYAQSQGLWWELALGTNANGGAGPYTHTLTPGGTLPSATVQVAMRDIGDVSRAKTYAGCKVNAITFSAASGQVATLAVDLLGGVAETWATAAASASYATNANFPLVFREASVSVNGSSVNCTAFEVKIDNQLQARETAGVSVSKEHLRGNRVKVSGKATIELEDLTESNLYVNGTAIDVVLGVTDGTYGTTVTVHTKLTGSTPQVSGPGINMFDLTWEDAYGDGTDADGLTVVYTDATSTP